HRLAVLAKRVDRREPDGRRGVSRGRLDDQVAAGKIRQRLADAVDMRPAANHPGARRRGQRTDARIRFRQERVVRDEPEKLLRFAGARERPETRAASSGKQDGVQAHFASTGAPAISRSWRRMRAVAPQTVVPPTVYHVSSYGSPSRSRCSTRRFFGSRKASSGSSWMAAISAA